MDGQQQAGSPAGGQQLEPPHAAVDAPGGRRPVARREAAQLAPRGVLAGGIRRHPRRVGAHLPVAGLGEPRGGQAGERRGDLGRAAALDDGLRLEQPVGCPFLAPVGGVGPFEHLGAGQVAGDHRGHGVDAGIDVAAEAGQAAQGPGRQRAAVEPAALEAPGEVPVEPLGGLAIDGARRATFEGAREQAEIAPSGPRLGRDLEEQRPGLAAGAPFLGLGEPAGEPRLERQVPALARRAEALPVALLLVELLQLRPGFGSRRHHREGLLAVRRGRQPGTDQAGERLGVGEDAGEQLPPALALGRRQRRPELQVGAGEQAGGFGAPGGEGDRRLERPFPGRRRGEQPRVVRQRPGQVGRGPHHHRRLPGRRPLGEGAGRQAGRLGEAGGGFGALAGLLGGRQVRMAGRIELGGERGARRPQLDPPGVGLVLQLARSDDAAAAKPGAHLLLAHGERAQPQHRHHRQGERRGGDGGAGEAGRGPPGGGVLGGGPGGRDRHRHVR